jgi:hypothetical protein
MTEQSKIAVKGIYSALAAAQAEMGPALKDSTNPAFRSKYADLASVMAACMPALNKHGICVWQPICDDDGKRYVKTVLAHESGDTLECRVELIVAKNDMQGYGSAVTYARRYGLMSMAGIAPEDDDGNAAAKAAPKDAPVIEEKPLRNAWRDAVMDTLPDNATPRQIAEAFAGAICMDVAAKGLRALDNAWSHHESMIRKFEADYPDLHEKVIDAFENRRNELQEAGK